MQPNFECLMLGEKGMGCMWENTVSTTSLGLCTNGNWLSLLKMDALFLNWKYLASSFCLWFLLHLFQLSDHKETFSCLYFFPWRYYILSILWLSFFILPVSHFLYSLSYFWVLCCSISNFSTSFFKMWTEEWYVVFHCWSHQCPVQG